jgi:2-dehydropantoate 2-reductase
MTTAKPMRLLIVGAGAVGGFLAARTLEAGHDATVLVHPGRARSLREHGLTLVSQSTTTTTRPAVVTADELTDGFDAVVLAVKANVLDAAMADIAPAVTPATMVVPFLNGMGHLDRLVDRFGSSVIGGALRVATELQADGSVRVLDPTFGVDIGELDGQSSERTDALGAAFRAAGAEVTVSGHIVRDMWGKWVFIASIGAITGLMRAPIGEIVSVPGGEAFARAVVAEADGVATAAGYPLTSASRQGLERTVTTPGSPVTSSLSRDLLDDRPTEVEPVLGDLVARAEAAGLPVPYLTASTLALRVHNHRLLEGRKLRTRYPTEPHGRPAQRPGHLTPEHDGGSVGAATAAPLSRA